MRKSRKERRKSEGQGDGMSKMRKKGCDLEGKGERSYLEDKLNWVDGEYIPSFAPS